MPTDLIKLYTHILSNLDEEDRTETSTLLRWVYFAKQPLSPNELRIAMAFDTDMPYSSLKVWRESDEYIGNLSQWKERITHLSGGLAEVVGRKTGDDLVVQFIHESVNDYLRKEGILMLGIKQTGSVIGECHNHIARSCIYYIRCPEYRKFSRRAKPKEGYGERDHDHGHDHDQDDSADADDNDNDNNNDKAKGEKYGDGDENVEKCYEIDDLEFIEYATNYWLWHSEWAENENCSQEHILACFDFPSPKIFRDWLWLFTRHFSSSGIEDWPIDYWYSSKVYNSGSTFLHIASGANLLSVAKVLLTRNQINGKGEDGEISFERKSGRQRGRRKIWHSVAEGSTQGSYRGGEIAFE